MFFFSAGSFELFRKLLQHRQSWIRNRQSVFVHVFYYSYYLFSHPLFVPLFGLIFSILFILLINKRSLPYHPIFFYLGIFPKPYLYICALRLITILMMILLSFFTRIFFRDLILLINQKYFKTPPSLYSFTPYPLSIDTFFKTF